MIHKITHALSKSQQKFLKVLLQKMKSISPGEKINLQKWDGSEKGLNIILHKLGLQRLAKALINEDENIRWHIIHLLDTGRGKTLSKYLEKLEGREISPTFYKQSVKLIHMFKN